MSFFTPTMSSKGEGKLKNPDPSEGSSYRASSEREDVPIALEKRGLVRAAGRGVWTPQCKLPAVSWGPLTRPSRVHRSMFLHEHESMS